MSLISHRRFGIAFLACVALAALAFSVPQPSAAKEAITLGKECQKLFNQYKNKPKPKAFAASEMTAKGQACGLAWGGNSKKVVEDMAVKSCHSQKRGKCVVTKSAI